MQSLIDLVVDANYWGANGTPHEALRELRNREPVARYDGQQVDPFWLLTRHDDIESVSKNPALWSSVPRTILATRRGAGGRLRSMVHMDPPDHTRHRAIVQNWLTPRTVRQLENRMREVSKELVDLMAESQSCDFVQTVSSVQPVRLLCELLGLGGDQESEVQRLAKLLFAGNDSELSGAMSPEDNMKQIMLFCEDLMAARQRKPSNDLASFIVNSKIADHPLDRFEALSNLAVILTAGHDTTASAMSGTLLALIQNPGELQRLQTDRSLMPTAIEEFVRWVTPTTNFVRTATAEAELRGVRIMKGDDICLHYSSANRDESIFEDPYTFRIDRRPNKHFGFGTGTHSCVGQILARLEMRALFEELIPRLESIELDGDPKYIQAYWISGLKRLPVRYSLK
jgi:cytochrome P450